MIEVRTFYTRIFSFFLSFIILVVLKSNTLQTIMNFTAFPWQNTSNAEIHFQCFTEKILLLFCFLSPLLSCKLFLLTYVLLFYVTGGHCCSSRVKGELNWKKHYGLWEWNKKHTHKNKQKTPRRFKCKRFKRMLFIWTKRNMQIFRVIPFIKLQNNT